MPWKNHDGGHVKKGAEPGKGGFVIDTDQYEKLRKLGMSKKKAAAIANSRNKAAMKRAADKSDADDTPEEQELLQLAWSALAQYVTTCDDDDRQKAIVTLGMVASLISGDGDDERESAAETWTCLYCPNRTFASEGALAAHLSSVHADENKSAFQPDKKE